MLSVEKLPYSEMSLNKVSLTKTFLSPYVSNISVF